MVALRIDWMLRRITTPCVVLLCLLGGRPAVESPVLAQASLSEADEIAIAVGGKAMMPIIIADAASDDTKSVAMELADYLHRITGASFDVTTGDGSSGIVLGTLAEFAHAELAPLLEIRRGFDGREAFAVRTEPGRLLLVGATDLGASHAAFRFLELIGCRWFFPAKEWEVIPIVPDLRLRHSEVSRPTILSRRIAYGCGLMRENGNPAELARSRSDYDAWCRHNRMASSLQIRTGHMWRSVINANKAEFDKHPEYYALVNGVRREGGKFEVANPVVRKMVVDYVLDRFRKNPDFDMLSVEPADGKNHSESEEARQLGTFSDQVFGLANEVARAVQKEFPGKMVGLLAYGWHSDPPSFDLEPNVYVQLTTGFVYSQYTDEQRIDLWAKRCRHMGFYEYYSVWPWDRDRLPGGRAANIAYLQDSIRQYAERNATSVTAESGNNWGLHGVGYYVANRLLWDPQADVTELLNDFYEKAFGPAAPAMRRYYERFNRGNRTLWSRHELAMTFRDVAAASELAHDRPDIQARLDHLKQYLRYNHLCWLLDRAKSQDERKALTLAILTHCYRTRFSYMNHWEAMRQLWINKAAEAFEEPTWSLAHPSQIKPWQVKSPPTSEETQEQFHAGLAFFQPQPVAERSFSEDLVPVVFGGAAIASSQSWAGEVRYALYSVAGEPIEMDLDVGLLEMFHDKGDPHYMVSDINGHALARGPLPIGESGKHHLKIAVPTPGLYFLDMAKPGAGWRVGIASGRSATMMLAKDQILRPILGRMQDMYFYVPKGTRQIEYCWHGGPHRVMDPNGQTVVDTDVDGEFVFVPVPPGEDGQVWKLSGGAKRLWFFNVPNGIAASPDALLIPREVVQADGLVPRR